MTTMRLGVRREPLGEEETSLKEEGFHSGLSLLLCLSRCLEPCRARGEQGNVLEAEPLTLGRPSTTGEGENTWKRN